jgi:hypothetical protein
LKELPKLLTALGLNNFHVSRSVDELVYTGVALRVEDSVVINNELYWLYEQAHRKGFDWSDKTGAVWAKIEVTERSLRNLVSRRYQRKWGDHATAMMESVLGDTSWQKIEQNYDASTKRYPLSETAELQIIDVMYIGQFLTLITANKAWHLFEDVFKNKQSLINIFGAIVPVRNDQAHFNSVPEKELLRCYIACDDLSVLIDRAEDTSC